MVLNRKLVDGIVNSEKIEDILHYISQLTTLSSQDAKYFSEKICQVVNLVLDDLLGNKEFAYGILDVLWCVVGRNLLDGDAGGSLIYSLLMLALEKNCPVQLLRQTMVCANQILRSKQALSAFFDIGKETSSIMLHLGKMLFNTGDYETQAVILEAVFRLSNPSNRKYWSEKWFPSDQLKEQFLNFKPEEFELECRKFLNSLNSTQGSSRRVYSFICKSVTFGGYKVQKPYDSDLWVDFNLDGQSLSLYCADLNQDEDVSNSQSLWETIMLEKNNVVYCSTSFGVNQEYQLINIQLHRPCTDLIGNSTAHRIHGNNVLIILPEDDIVHSLLQNIYGELYQGQVVASSQQYDDSNEENPNVSKLETEINSNQPFTVSSTVNKNILKRNSYHTPLKEGLKSSETSRDVHMSSSKVEVNLPEKNYMSRRVQTTANSELSAAKTLYTFTEDSGLGSSISATTRKYKSKNKVPPIKKVEKRSGRSSKNLKSKKTMETYTSISSENAQSEEIKGKSHFSVRGRMYPPLKISGLYSFTSSEDEPQDPEVIWLSQKEQRKYSVGKKKKSKKITRRKSSGTDWSDIEKFELTVEPSSVSKRRMRLSRSDNKSKDTQKELAQLVHEASHDNSGIDVSVIHSVNMISSTEELSAQNDSTVLSDSLEKIKSVSSGNKTDITQKEYSCKGLCGLGMEDKSDNIIQKARFGTVPESEILGSKSTESLNIDTKSRTDCTENKSEQKLNTTCIQEEKQHSMLEKNYSVRHHESPIRYPDVSSSSDELVNFTSFKQSFGEELQKKFRMLLQELVSPEQLRSRPFKWRNSLSDLGSPDIIPPNNSPETGFVLSPVGRSEKFSFDTTWPNSKHEKRLMMTTPGLYTPAQKVQFQGNDKLSKMKATVEPDYIHNAKKNRSSSVISSQESVLKRKYSSLQNEPQLSHMGRFKKRLFTPGTKPSFSETDISPLKQELRRANIHLVEELIHPHILNIKCGKKQQAVDRPVNNYWKTNYVFSDVKSEIVQETLEEQVKTLSKKYVNTVQRCISTFSNQLVEYRKQVSDTIASITGESHTTFQVDSDLLTYLKESKNHMLKVVHKLVKLEETVHLLRLAENKLEKKLQEIQKKATIKYQQQLQQVIEESFKEMDKSMLKQLHHLSAFNLFI